MGVGWGDQLCMGACKNAALSLSLLNIYVCIVSLRPQWWRCEVDKIYRQDSRMSSYCTINGLDLSVDSLTDSHE